MSETPRVRLKSLIDGLELPKGFKLTPAREEALRAVGMLLVRDGKLECYGNKVSYMSLLGRWKTSMSTSAKAALRGMAKSGWVKAEMPPPAGSLHISSPRWVHHTVVWQPGLEQLALRLGARQLLWAERKNAPIEAARAAVEEVRMRLREAQQIMNRATYSPLIGENDVLETYKKLRAYTAEVSEAEEKMAKAKAVVESVPEPTEDEAFAWLMERALTRGG